MRTRRMNENPFEKLDPTGLPPGPPPKPVAPAAKAKPKLGKIILQYERAGRGGKEMKRALGTGGALEAREIVLQGDRRETAKAWLLKEGFTTNL